MSSPANNSSGSEESSSEESNLQTLRKPRFRKKIADTDSDDGSGSGDGEGSADGEEDDFRSIPVMTITPEMATDLDYGDDNDEVQRILELKVQRCHTDVRPGSSLGCFKQEILGTALTNVSSDNTLWVKFVGGRVSKRAKIHVRNILDITNCHCCEIYPPAFICCAEPGCPRVICSPLDKDCVKQEYLCNDAKLLYKDSMFVCGACGEDEYWDDFHCLNPDEYSERFQGMVNGDDLSAKKPKKKKRKEGPRKVRYVYLTSV